MRYTGPMPDAAARRIAVLLVAAVLAAAPVAACARSSPGTIAATDLPKEARDTLANVRRGPPFPYERDGVAFGLDRLAMLMAGADSIRDVIAFPKTQTATCPLTDAPTEVSEQQLRDLHIRVKLPVKE